MRINFFGDVCLQGIDPERFSIDPIILERIRGADWNVANLECPLTDATERQPYKHVHLKAPPVANPVLDLFDAFTLANNHVLDYREAGLRDTMAFLDREGKRRFGAGEDRERALEPLRVEVGGRRLAFVGFSQWQAATRRGPGATPRDRRALSSKVRELADEGRFVVAYGHWNYEYLDYPAPASRRLAHRLIDAGAHLVVGSHPHVVQGHERYRGKLVFHSLGNFVFDARRYPDKADTRIRETFVLSVDVAEDLGYDFDVLPVRTGVDGLSVLQGDDRARFLERLRRISDILRDDRAFREAFYAQASGAARRVSGEIGSMVRRQGWMYVLSRVHRITLQDVKIKFHSLLHP